jgi:sugar phosphate isomerase/epimerase
MKCAVSNLGFRGVAPSYYVPKLREIGIQGLEIALNELWPESPHVSKGDLARFRETLQSSDLEVSAIQSLLFGKAELQLLDRGCWSEMREHFNQIMWVAGELGAKTLVFGSPKNRIRADLPYHEALSLATEFFQSISEDLDKQNLTLAIEPNPRAYGADFLINYTEVCALVKMINHSSVGTQIDYGCLLLEGVNSLQAFLTQEPVHVQLSSPKLGQLLLDADFTAFLNLLNELEYGGWASIETLGDGMSGLNSALQSCIEVIKLGEERTK